MSSLIERSGKHYIKGKVVMLESKDQTHQVKEGDLFINDTRKYSWGKLEVLRCERVTQHGHAWNGTGIRTDICHLYITSDDKIKEGDWYLTDNNKVLQCTKTIFGLVYADNDHGRQIKHCRKIIATTDPSLGLPQPSESFIKAYIEAYNNGNVIEDILIEVYKEEDYEYSYHYHIDLKLKDSNIIIRKVKDSWNRDEVQQLLSDLSADLYHKRIGNGLAAIEKWIEENL
jgi:hypothetical protein